jgi:hypothetical protein
MKVVQIATTTAGGAGIAARRLNASLNLAGIESKLVAMSSIYGKIARTITCAKGKLTKKVTDVTPRCPAGYKKK